MWTTTGYWGFNADAYLAYASAEAWDVIPAAKRDTCSTLEAAASAYLGRLPRRQDGSRAVGLPLQSDGRGHAYR